MIAWLAGCGRPADPPPDARAPGNVLVVVLDDVGVERLRAYGAAEGPETPTLDGLAADGVLFRHAWATPLCSPSRASLLTGRYPGRTRVGDLVQTIGHDPDLDPAEITLPEVLAYAPDRWSTSLAGKWHLSDFSRGDPTGAPGEQGFDWFAGSLGNLQEPWDGQSAFSFGYGRWMKDDNGSMSVDESYATSDTADDAIARIRAMPEPWLLYVAFNAPHEPFHVPPANLVHAAVSSGSSDSDRYDAMIEAADTELGRILASMDPGQRARTTVLVTADNGTPAPVVQPPFDPQRAKGTVFELGVDVPLIVTGPDVAAPGSESNALVHLVDVLPTVADIAGVDLGDLGVPIDGRSLRPALRDPGAEVHDRLFTEKFSPNGDAEPTLYQRAIRDDRYKLIVAWKRGRDPRPVEALYDLSDAGVEQTDLADDPSLATERASLESALDSLEAGFSAR